MLKVSIATITYNSSSTLKETILSVINQDYPNVEYIIKDGGSTDETINIAETFKNKIHKIVSEKDAGLYDALNKAIDLCTGEIIGFIHSDDILIDHSVISDIANIFEKEKCDGLYANLYYVNRFDTSKIIRKWNSGKYKDGMFLSGWMPPHPTFFVKKECYENFGKFNLQLKSAADYELMLRFIHKNKIKISYLDKYIIKMRAGGQSNINLQNRLLANKEDRMAWKINSLKPNFYTLTWKPIRKILQYFL